MALRHKEALAIQDACNPAGVARTICDTIATMIREGSCTDDIRTDAAVRLMVCKLADLEGITYDWPHAAEEECRQLGQHSHA